MIEHNPDNSISFEGNYINGEKNGYIKEYDDSGQLIFEGEYAYGKRNGKGKEYIYKEFLFMPFTFLKINKYMKIEMNNNYDYESYLENTNNNDINKHLIYEGEYKNGLRNGKGKEYLDGKLIFEGEYLNGERNGKGKEYENGKLIFEGYYIKGKKNDKL